MCFVMIHIFLYLVKLTPDGKVKLADVGVMAKPENEITCTVCGTSIYLAPEVFEGRVYNRKSDMYSFGYVLWELWYGETAFGAAITSKPQHRLLEEVTKRDLRPTHIESTQHPWGIWQRVMTSCWNKEPGSRLTAGEGLQCLKQLQDGVNLRQKIPPTPPPRSSTPRPLPRRNTLPAKPTPAPRTKKREATSVVYHPQTEDGISLRFESYKK